MAGPTVPAEDGDNEGVGQEPQMNAVEALLDELKALLDELKALLDELEAVSVLPAPPPHPAMRVAVRMAKGNRPTLLIRGGCRSGGPLRSPNLLQRTAPATGAAAAMNKTSRVRMDVSQVGNESGMRDISLPAADDRQPRLLDYLLHIRPN
jgi:hypothetical protein